MGLMLKSAIVIAAAVLITAAAPAGPRFDRVYPLETNEGVFAYARISPDGHTLAYASESRERGVGRVDRTVRVVDLASRKILFTEPGIDAYWSNDGRRMIF